MSFATERSAANAGSAGQSTNRARLNTRSTAQGKGARSGFSTAPANNPFKRPVSGVDTTEHPSKRARRAAQANDLRLVQPSTNQDIVYISSTSPDGTDDMPPPLHMKPSGGIAPSDSLQDEVVNSIESARRGRNLRTGIEHYCYIAHKKAEAHAIITPSFDTYRRAAPPSAAAGNIMPDIPPQTPDLGLRDPKYDYSELPPHETHYKKPMYKTRTRNPVFALAIIRLAEENLPFLSFESDLAHLPNVGPQNMPPTFPQVDIGEPMPFLNAATKHMRKDTDDLITIVFLPEYYQDGRHAVGFWTRKKPSNRLCSIVCTPCTTKELRALGLLAWVPPTHGLPGSPDLPREDAEITSWHNFRFGNIHGEWLYPCVERYLEKWELAEKVVRFEWWLRVAVTTYPRAGIAEDDRLARKRDDGMWEETEWE